jgi:hypothetical protein
VDYQVECNVIHFETDSSGGSHLHAQWTIRDGTGKLLIARESEITDTEASSDKSPSASLSHNLGNLSQQIATQIQELSQPNNKRNAESSPTSPVRGVEVSKVGHFFLKVGTTFR